MNKKLYAVLVAMIIAVSAVNAQVASDPTDRFYTEAQGWELKGYVDDLPQLRPYSLNTIRYILESVIDNALPKDAAIAQEEYKRIFGDKAWNMYTEASATLKTSQKHVEQGGERETSKTKALTAEGGIEGDVVLHPLVGLSYDIGFWATSADYCDYAAYGVNQMQDSVFDPTTVGPIDAYADWNTNVSVGNAKVYASTGVNRVGFGPFLNDGLALNDTAFHSANILFNATLNKWSFASVYEAVGATRNDGEEDGAWLGSGKYLAFHALKYKADKKLNLTYYENVVFGKGTDLSFMIPAPYMAIQNIGGASANLQMGVVCEYRPVETLMWATDVSVDDIELNDLVKLHFDTKVRLAASTGLVYSPKESKFGLMSMYYTAVLPYYGCHWEYDNENESGYMTGSYYNYQNLTNAGVKIGTNLEPNSDRVAFKSIVNISPNIKLNFNTNFIRHANSAEAMSFDDASRYVASIKGNYRTDGSIYMHQMFADVEHSTSGKNHVEQAWDSLGFMTSDHIMKVYQAGTGCELIIPNRKNSKGRLSVNLGYTFEYIQNYGVDSNIYTGIFSNKTEFEDYITYINSDSASSHTYTAGGVSYTKDEIESYISSEVDRQYNEWLSGLYDRVNHYVSLSLKYAW